MKQSAVELLKDVLLFSSLEDNELNQVRKQMVLREYKKNQIILREEQTSEFMYVIISGKVKIYQVSDAGREIILAVHKAGEFFGEMSLIDGKTVPAAVSAVENSLVAVISRYDFYSMLHAHEQVLDNLLRILCSRIRESWRKIQMLNFNDATHRIKMLLLILAEEYGEKTAKGITLRIKLIHQDIADMTGLTRETVTRVLDKLKKSGEMTINKDKLIHLHAEFESIQL